MLGFALLPACLARQAGAAAVPRRQFASAHGWRGDEADLVVQYYRTPGDRSGTAELKGLPPDVRAMDSPLAISGRQLVWGVPNASARARMCGAPPAWGDAHRAAQCSALPARENN